MGDGRGKSVVSIDKSTERKDTAVSTQLLSIFSRKYLPLALEKINHVTQHETAVTHAGRAPIPVTSWPVQQTDLLLPTL
jgi:hypothetical protein